jgi:hypothetical protein
LLLIYVFQTELTTDNAYRFAVWCYVPDAELTGWDAPHVCELCLTAADAHHYARHLRGTFHGHLFGVLRVGATPRVAA